jgi:hypothetical protein
MTAEASKREGPQMWQLQRRTAEDFPRPQSNVLKHAQSGQKVLGKSLHEAGEEALDQ